MGTMAHTHQTWWRGQRFPLDLGPEWPHPLTGEVWQCCYCCGLGKAVKQQGELDLGLFLFWHLQGMFSGSRLSCSLTNESETSSRGL